MKTYFVHAEIKTRYGIIPGGMTIHADDEPGAKPGEECDERHIRTFVDANTYSDAIEIALSRWEEQMVLIRGEEIA